MSLLASILENILMSTFSNEFGLYSSFLFEKSPYRLWE